MYTVTVFKYTRAHTHTQERYLKEWSRINRCIDIEQSLRHIIKWEKSTCRIIRIV